MLDWTKVIEERLGRRRLPPALQTEIERELATHLEDLYQEQIGTGMTDLEALNYVLSQQANWPSLARNIERAKRKEGIMNQRSKQFWLPALLSLAASMIWLMAIELVADKLHMEWKYANLAFLPYVIWIITLPLIGAASGHFSYRAGSRRAACFVAVAFPALVMFVMWLVIIAFVLARKSAMTVHIGYGLLLYGLLLWAVVPGAALLAGTLPLSRYNELKA
jgi:hypothetical protein